MSAQDGFHYIMFCLRLKKFHADILRRFENNPSHFLGGNACTVRYANADEILS